MTHQKKKARGGEFSRAEMSLRAAALEYPDVTEDFPWDHRAMKVKGKVFVFLSYFEGVFRVTVKLPVSNTQALSFPFAEPTGYGMGKHGWVTAAFRAGDAVPLDLLREWIDESFRAVAPKKLVAALEVGDAEPSKKGRKESKG
jgi:predicted DNA-binding protein (MmcQ/YjbR family)